MALSRLLPRLQPRPEPVPEPVEEEPVAVTDEPPRLQAVPAPAPAPEAEGALMANVIVLANQKGGVAKTTTTLNLGVALHEKGHRVLVIDLDPQGNLTMSQGMNPDAIDRSMFDVLVHRIPISDIIKTVEVDVAVASIDLAGAELALSALIGRERALEKALVEVRDRYDYILIDTPPSLGLLDDQRVRRRGRRDRAGAVRVPLAARARAAREHARDGAREPQSEGARPGHRPDDVRRTYPPCA